MNIPAIKPDTHTKEELKLIADREDWTRLYDHWLKRKNKFAVKLANAGRQTAGSDKYKELDTQVKKYWTLLRESLPAYKAMFNQRHK